MKKKLQLFLMLSIVLFSSGCMKMEISLGINKDKSMDVTMIEAIDKQAMSQLGGEAADTLLTDEDIKELESTPGVTVEEYKEDSLEGFKVTRRFSNIDDLSSEEEIDSDLSILTDMENVQEESYVFQIRKGLFKNTYKASFTGMTEDVDSMTRGEEISGLEGIDPSTLTSQIDFTFAISLPYGSIYNNATSVENDGKTLVWNLMEFKEEAVEFEFELYNMQVIYIALGIAVTLILILVILVFITLINNKKHSKKQSSEEVNMNDMSQMNYINGISQIEMNNVNQIPTDYNYPSNMQ